MIRLLLLCLLVVGWMLYAPAFGVAQDQDLTETESPEVKAPENLYWVFLTTGKSLEGIDRDEVEAMQTEHLNNFRRLAEDGRLLTAGPMSDPENVRRGIVILKVAQRDELIGMFREDPYVKQGYMNVDACKMQFELGKIHTRIAPKGMEELRIVVLERNPESDEEIDAATSEQTANYLKNLYDQKKLNLSIRLFDQKNKTQHILVFPKLETDEETLETVNQIPAVKAGFWKQETMPLFMGKGSIDREEE
ncbi:MAG: YciI family protein [Mariniblastus sp.]|nr:YciI family protein [Mariniblastus sp.]